MKKCLFLIDALVVWCPTWSKNLARSLTHMHFVISHLTRLSPKFRCFSWLNTASVCTIEIVQDFWIKLGIKPLMHLVEMGIFSLNNDLVSLIPKYELLCQNSELQSHFSVSKIGRCMVWCPNWSKNLERTLVTNQVTQFRHFFVYLWLYNCIRKCSSL